MRKICFQGVSAPLALLLVGCATGWTHPNKGAAEFNADRADCMQQANASFPPAIVQPPAGPGYQAPSTTNCRATGYGTATCTTTPGQTVPGIQPPSYDANLGARMSTFSSCMQARGWRT